MNSSELTLTTNPSILLIGDGGTEKTRFLAQCPVPYVYDFDAGMASTKEFGVEYDTFKDLPFGAKVKPDPKRGMYEWGTAWPAWIKHLNEVVQPLLEAGTWPYKTLGVDSITTLSSQCMNYVLKTSGKTASAAPEIQHWGIQLRLMETVMEQLAAWSKIYGITIVVTAHIKRDDNLVMGTREFLPMVTGQLSGRIGIYFDEVYYTEAKSGAAGQPRSILLITNGDALYKQAKSRYNVANKTPAKWEAIAPKFGVKNAA